ncbi:MAG: hypothetical protein L0Y58_17560, partial [Verrucomicrobia subdivision 3 bacterium]|nr:hypothetical protein [Limisphaerales bacterium]
KREGVAPLQVRRFQRERERLYSILDPDERQAAFSRLHLEWFREWGMENMLRNIIASFPLLSRYLGAIGFRKARDKFEEGADLYVNPEGLRHGIVALCPQRFQHENALQAFLNHELMHLSDMVDPAFGYSRDIYQAHQTESQCRLIRQRYRLLWDVSIDGRLLRAGKSTVATPEQRRAEFDRAFVFLPAARRDQTFASLWNNSRTHADLLALASDPRDAENCEAQVPGAPCPLCGFAAFQWGDVSALKPEALAEIERAFPAWRHHYGACARCIEIYESIVGVEFPPTVCV